MKIDTERLPAHIAIIMDGNGRWAKQRFLPRIAGHKKGVDAMVATTKAVSEIGIKVLSFFAFSTENWKREKSEVDAIFGLVEDYLDNNQEDYTKNNIKVVTMGNLNKLKKSLKNKVEEVVEKTKNNTGLIVNIGLNYGGRDEIVNACNLAIENNEKKLSVKSFTKYLYTKNLPDVDLLIRTSGEQRISNFMLFQLSYAELYFPKLHWPDFNKKQLLKSIKNYQKRDRRFGNVK